MSYKQHLIYKIKHHLNGLMAVSFVLVQCVLLTQVADVDEPVVVSRRETKNTAENGRTRVSEGTNKGVHKN